MPAATISVIPYLGSLLSAQLLSPQTTLVLSAFGAAQTGTLTDNDGLLAAADSGVATYDGQPLTYIGSGTVQPGVALGGLTVPLGAAKTVVVFEAGGRIYFHFPAGPPDLTAAVAMVANITPAPYQVFSPVCFCRGTRIATPAGERPVEELEEGDLVLDHTGRSHRAAWIASRRMPLPMGLSDSFAKWLPVRIPRGSLGPGLPERDLCLSQQHRILIRSDWADLLFGSREVLVAAKALTGDRVRIESDVREVHYYHILCEDHVILRANGLPCESMFLGDVALRDTDFASLIETTEIFPQIKGRLRRMRAAAPMLRPREGRLLAQSLN